MRYHWYEHGDVIWHDKYKEYHIVLEYLGVDFSNNAFENYLIVDHGGKIIRYAYFRGDRRWQRI